MLPRDLRANTRRRVDYRPPAFLVDTITLEFDLDPGATRVAATLAFRRNPGAEAEDRAVPLALDGEQQADVSVELDGVLLPASRVAHDETGLAVLDPPESGTLSVRSTIAGSVATPARRR